MAEWREGDSLPVVEKFLTQEQIARYADASGDFNPLHLDPEFASKTQFGGIISHGMLTLAFISEMLTKTFGRAWLETGNLKVKLRGAARPGDTVTTWGKVTRSASETLECSVGIKNSKGEELISGVASVKLSD